MFDLLAGGISDRIPGETLFTRFHGFLGPGIEDARFDPLPPTEVTDGDLPTEPFQDYADLVFRGVLPAGPGPDLPDESLGLLGRGLCYLGLSVDILGHFRLLSRCGRSIPCTRSPNTPPPSCFYPFKSVPLSLNAYTYTKEGLKDAAEELPGYLGGGLARKTDRYQDKQVRQAVKKVREQESAAAKSTARINRILGETDRKR